VINFRYHVVSIVAVFMALAIGIVLGATELQGTTIYELNKTSKSLSDELNAEHTQNGLLQQQVTADQGFAQDSEARLLNGLLTGQRVVIVAAPDAPGAVLNGVTAAVRQAGASVTGQVNLLPKLLDASQSNQTYLSALVQQLVQAGGSVANGSPLQQAAQLLGSAILTKSGPGDSSSGGTSSGGSTGGSSTTVLSSYSTAGLLSVSGALSTSQATAPATLAIVVIPSTTPAGGDNDPANQGLITLAQEFDTAGLGTVMAGSVSGSVNGSAINALRASSASAQISTVDDADTLEGQIVTVEALAQALNGHKGSSWGEDAGAAAAGPDPAPTPTASTPSSTTQTTGTKTHTDGHTSDPKPKGRA
jgi:hypothetical protein